MEADEARLGQVCHSLVARGSIWPLDLGSPRDCEAWAACDLANMVEGCFHEVVDPSTIDTRRWLSRLGRSYTSPRFADDDWLTRWFWLGRAGERLGTIALPVSPFGRRRVPLYSLYVVPARRQHGIASQTLQALYDECVVHGFRGVQLETHWAWQRSLRFYLQRRMWVVDWKHAITLGWDQSWPRWEIEESADTIAFSVGGTLALTAYRRGDRLELGPHGELGDEVHATLSMSLAMRGWPLVRSAERWLVRWRPSELGQVEALAAKIGAFEQAHRFDGWDLRTPQIPGLPAGEDDR